AGKVRGSAHLNVDGRRSADRVAAEAGNCTGAAIPAHRARVGRVGSRSERAQDIDIGGTAFGEAAVAAIAARSGSAIAAGAATEGVDQPGRERPALGKDLDAAAGSTAAGAAGQAVTADAAL